MQFFDSVQALRNGKKYSIVNSINMSEGKTSESNLILSTREGNVNDKTETRALIQEEVDEQMRGYCSPDWVARGRASGDSGNV